MLTKILYYKMKMKKMHHKFAVYMRENGKLNVESKS